MFFARPPALIMARCHSIKFFWPGVILIKFWIGERILDALWGGARFRVVAVFWVIPEHPTGLLADDDATTTTRNTKLASCLVRPRARANLAKTVSRCRIDPPAPRFASVWGGWHGKGRKKETEPRNIRVEEIQRKSQVREWTPQNAPRIRAGVTKKDQKAKLKKNQTRRCDGEKKRFFSDDRQTPARREARNHRSEDARMLGPPPCGPQRTGRADQRDARGGGESRPKYPKPPPSGASLLFAPRSDREEAQTTKQRPRRDTASCATPTRPI